MNDVILKLNDEGKGAFLLMDGDEQAGQIEVSISGNDLTVHHTEVFEKWEGKGYAKHLFNAMVDHALTNGLKVTALCPYIHAQFKRRADEYADVWIRE